jgi:hypothetical protein
MAWWRPDCRGYTSAVAEAGRFSLAEARGICRQSARRHDHCWLDNTGVEIPYEVIVPSPELLAAVAADVHPVRELKEAL